jgi:predicted membrane protein
MVLGLIVILLGVLFTLDNLYILDAREYLRYWPVLVIVFGLVKVLQPAGSPGKPWGVILLIVGTLLLLNKFDFISLRFRDLWPIVFILIGGSLIWGSLARRRLVDGGESKNPGANDATVNGLAILGGFTRLNNSQDFRGGELTAIMGGCELDLRQASIKEEEAVLNIFAFWGGIKVKVPDTWSVTLQGVPILGGFEDKTRPQKETTGKRLVVKGTAIMGGAEITN